MTRLPNQPPRIAPVPRLVQVISTPSGIGGAEQVVLALAGGAKERGWEHVLLNPFASSEREALGERLGSREYEPIIVEGPIPLALLRMRTRLHARISQLRPDIVLACLPLAGLALAGRPRVAGEKRVYTHQHGRHFVAENRRSVAYLDRLAGRTYDRVVACSESVCEFLLQDYRYPTELVTTIRNGWSGSPLPRRANGERRPTIVCTANFREQKGHAVLLRAFSRIVGAVPGAELVLVGSGPRENRIRQQVGDLGLRAAVTFAGAQRDIWPWLAGADVFCLASHYEPLGIAVLEAMAAGLPVVATRVDGICELVQPGVQGELVDRGDDEAMASAVTALLKDPELARRQGAEGVRRAREEKLSVMVGRYFDLFLDLIHKP